MNPYDQSSPSGDEWARLSNAQLNIAIAGFEQDAANAMDMRREAALRAGQDQIEQLDSINGNKIYWFELIVAISLEAAIGLFTVFYVEDLQKVDLDFLRFLKNPNIRTCISAAVLLLLIGGAWLAIRIWVGRPIKQSQKQREKRDFLKETLQRVCLAYLAHTELDNQIQGKKQKTVAGRTRLMPYEGDRWKEILSSGNADFVLRQINALMTIDNEILKQRQLFDQAGGQFVLNVYQAVLHNQIPWILATFIMEGCKEEPDIEKWKQDAKQILSIHRFIDSQLTQLSPLGLFFQAETPTKKEVQDLNDKKVPRRLRERFVDNGKNLEKKGLTRVKVISDNNEWLITFEADTADDNGTYCVRKNANTFDIHHSVYNRLLKVVAEVGSFIHGDLETLTSECKSLFRFDSQSLNPKDSPASFLERYFPQITANTNPQ